MESSHIHAIVPKKLKDKLKKEGVHEHRDLTGQLIAILEERYERGGK